MVEGCTAEKEAQTLFLDDLSLRMSGDKNHVAIQNSRCFDVGVTLWNFEITFHDVSASLNGVAG